ncbi:MAG TPA: hypothetical protein GX010_02745 [Erysipelotrichaceae bacterium]|nr:hypothetical protein [Erysipelotrichaceae bacterium]
MNKLAKIFLTINGILGVFLCIALTITTATFFIFTLPAANDLIIAAAEEGLFDALAVETVEELLTVLRLIFSFFTFLFILLLAFAVVSTVVSFKAIDAKSKSLYIANIVFGALTSSGFGVAGGIIGLIALNKENNQNYVDNPIDN